MDNQITEKKSWQENCRPGKRRLIQLYSAVLYNAYVKGFIKGEIYTGKTKLMCVPGFNCYSCPAAVGACPLGSLQNALASSGNRVGFYVFGIIMLFVLLKMWGRKWSDIGFKKSHLLICYYTPYKA